MKTNTRELPQQLVWAANVLENTGRRQAHVWCSLARLCSFMSSWGRGNCMVSFGRWLGRSIKVQKHKSHGQIMPLPEVYSTDTLTCAWNYRILTQVILWFYFFFCNSKMLVKNLNISKGKMIKYIIYINIVNYYAAVRIKELFSPDRWLCISIIYLI